MMINKYKNLFLSHTDCASDKWNWYFPLYDKFFSQFIGKKANFLEVGIQNCGNLQIMKKFLENGKVFGIDIDPKVLEVGNLGSDINVFCFDGTDKELFDKNLRDTAFDIILDDGSHTQKDVINLFKHAFKRLNPGGIYFIEDVHTSYWSEWGGGHSLPAINNMSTKNILRFLIKRLVSKAKSSVIKTPNNKTNGKTMMEYFKDVADLVNAEHFYSHRCTGKIELTEFEKYLANEIESIMFFDSVIVITKNPPLSEREKKRRLLVGTRAAVNKETMEEAKREGWYWENNK